MGYNSFLRSPKKEEQEVPNSPVLTKFSDTKSSYADEEVLHIMDELEGIWGIEDEEKLPHDSNKYGQLLNWPDFMDWEEFPNGEGEEQQEQKVVIESTNRSFFEEERYYSSKVAVKRENVGFCDDDDDDDKGPASLNLNLNYEDVLDAWSNRGSPWADADAYSLSVATNGRYMGEGPVMEEERTRREARVLRYKEKRQTRLFSKKIRYQVRKLNADKRPRLKGRFVKRVS